MGKAREGFEGGGKQQRRVEEGHVWGLGSYVQEVQKESESGEQLGLLGTQACEEGGSETVRGGA